MMSFSFEKDSRLILLKIDCKSGLILEGKEKEDQLTRSMSSQSKRREVRVKPSCSSSSLTDLPKSLHTFTSPFQTTSIPTTTTTTTTKGPLSLSDHSISLIREGAFEQTRIELRFPPPSSSTSCYSPSRRRQRTVREDVEGEFTLPTDPPITVTIQSDLNRNPFHSSSSDPHFARDEIFSEHDLNSINVNRRQSFDPSLKGTSTIVNYFMDLLKPSDNKLAMKLFGSKKGVLKERLRQQRAGHCIIHPCSTFRSISSLLFSSSVLFKDESLLDSIGI